jgi:transposase
LRATYTRSDGVMHMLAALDLSTGRLFYRIRARKRWTEFLGLLKALRARSPDEKLYVVCDNFSPHRRARVRSWCEANRVELVFLPTYGSWLNWIEAEFAALCYFALNGTDHRSHAEQNTAIAAYVRRRNARAQPKANFAVGPPIRTWTNYPAKAAWQATRPSDLRRHPVQSLRSNRPQRRGRGPPHDASRPARRPARKIGAIEPDGSYSAWASCGRNGAALTRPLAANRMTGACHRRLSSRSEPEANAQGQSRIPLSGRLCAGIPRG